MLLELFLLFFFSPFLYFGHWYVYLKTKEPFATKDIKKEKKRSMNKRKLLLQHLKRLQHFSSRWPYFFVFLCIKFKINKNISQFLFIFKNFSSLFSAGISLMGDYTGAFIDAGMHLIDDSSPTLKYLPVLRSKIESMRHCI